MEENFILCKKELSSKFTQKGNGFCQEDVTPPSILRGAQIEARC